MSSAMNESQVAKRTSMTEFDPEGDVIFQLSDGSKLRVASKVLSLASPVWKAMFSSRFAEGNEILKGVLRGDKLYTIKLPDDNPDGVKNTLTILHYRPDLAPDEYTPSMLEEVAIVTDKYDCARSMKLFSQVVLREYAFDERFTGRLLYPAIAFDNPMSFEQTTKHMVRSMTDLAFYQMINPAAFNIPVEIQLLLPEGLLDVLKVQYIRVKATMLESIENVIKPLLEEPIKNGRSQLGNKALDFKWFSDCSIYISRYLHEMFKRGLWPVSSLKSHSLGELLEKMANFGFEPFVLSYDHVGSACRMDFAKEVAAIRSAAEASITGLCLDCVKHGPRASGEAIKCRVPHDGYLGL